VTRLIAGIDEVGYGSFAGPVSVACVIFELDTDNPQIPQTLRGVRDSKKLSPKKRETFCIEIKKHAVEVQYVESSVKTINKKNIRVATDMAIAKVLKKCKNQPDYVYLDGNHFPDIPYDGEAVVGGDDSIFVISAASIVAKVTRDSKMVKLGNKFPEYFWKFNKGYGTIDHIAAIKKYGYLKEFHREKYIRNISPLIERKL